MQRNPKVKKNVFVLGWTGVFAGEEPQQQAWTPASRRLHHQQCTSLVYSKYAKYHGTAVHVNTLFGKLSQSEYVL